MMNFPQCTVVVQLNATLSVTIIAHFYLPITRRFISFSLSFVCETYNFAHVAHFLVLFLTTHLQKLGAIVALSNNKIPEIS